MLKMTYYYIEKFVIELLKNNKFLFIISLLILICGCNESILDTSKSKRFQIDSFEVSKNWDVLFEGKTNESCILQKRRN